jgi:hypothetical protein
MILLVGKRDFPADGVQDYCEYLGKALARRGHRAEFARVDWDSEGWVRALRELWDRSKAWRGRWVVLQYTALAWSGHGFPFGVLAVVAILRRRGVRCAVVFHEPFGLGGSRVIDRFRGACQNWVVRRLYDLGEQSIFPDPLESIEWLASNDQKAISIPIGANIPDGATTQPIATGQNSVTQTVAIYCLSFPPYLDRELADISHAVSVSVTGGANLRVVFLGRGTSEAGKEIKMSFESIPVEVSTLGLQSPNNVRNALAHSHVMLCVRGPLYPRRASALAGIACGLPVVGYAGAAEGTPMAEAGVELVPYGDREALGAALRRILLDRKLWQELHEKSLQTHSRYFSWGLIAEKFEHALNNDDENTRAAG